MELFGIEKLSLVDYDGKVASTVFTATCNFRCGFCHNGPLVENTEILKPLDIENDVYNYLKKRSGIIEGVCVTGGEPTLQKDLPDFCEKLKNIGLSVKLDTNGTNPEMVKTLYENKLVDYFAMDIKNDKENYAEIIGLTKYDTRNVEKTVEYFLSSGCDYEFRTTLINEYHKKDNIERIAEWIKGAKKYALQKFKQVDTCLSNTLHEVSIENAKSFLEIVKPKVKTALLRGYD